MSKFLNISNHNLTVDQLAEIDQKGWEAVELPEDLKKAWGSCNPSNYQEIVNDIVHYMIVNNINSALLAGYSPAVVYACMEYACRTCMFYFAHTERKSVETVQEDGSVVKTNVFKHAGFYQYPFNLDME